MSSTNESSRRLAAAREQPFVETGEALREERAGEPHGARGAERGRGGGAGGQRRVRLLVQLTAANARDGNAQ